MVGREKRLVFSQNTEKLWQLAKPYLQKPIKKMVWVNTNNQEFLGFISGESALSMKTMLSTPKNNIFAVNSTKFLSLKGTMGFKTAEFPDEHSTQLELWRYNPGLLTDDNVIDPLSLWLNLKGNDDERISIALESLINAQWGKD